MPAELISLIKDRPGTTHPGVYAITDRGWRRLHFKRPGKNFARRTLIRNQRRLAFCQSHQIPPHLTPA